VGSEEFVRRTRQRIGIKVKGRKVVEKGGAFTLREPMSDYGLYSGPENSPIVPEKYYHKMWLDLMISMGYTDSIFNTYSISKYFFCLFHSSKIPVLS